MAKVIEVRGTKRVRNQFAIVESYNPELADEVIAEHAKQEQRELRNTPYPPALAHFSHRRKQFFGGIAGSFSARRLKQGQWVVMNSRLYAQYVIGSRQRSHPSFSRWWLMSEEMQKRMPVLTKRLAQHLERKLDRA